MPDGAAILTPHARLLPVRQNGVPAMLKVALEQEEGFAAILLKWWDGVGVARVFEAADNAILIERALGAQSLSAWARQGRDDDATIVLCDTLAALHAPRGKAVPGNLVSLETWFADLWPAAATHGGVLAVAADYARRLLNDPRDVMPLHGDCHHDNVLDFGARGWLAIDPKRLLGERTFDYTILFCDPDLADAQVPVATRPEIFAKRLERVQAHTGLPRERLLAWIIAWCGLSAAWFINDGDDTHAAINFQVAAFASVAASA